MQFLDKLHLKAKLLYLFLLISLGLLLVSTIGFINFTAMKKNLDNLYFGSLIPVIELQSIQENYQKNIQNTLYRVRNKQLNPNEAIILIQEGLSKIDKAWGLYKNRYKRQEELPYVAYTDQAILNTKHYFNRVIALCNHTEERPPLEFQTMETKLESIHAILAKLIKYEVDYAHYERQTLLSTYNDTLVHISVIIIIIIIALLSITLAIFKSIQKQQYRLEITSQKLIQANKKLEDASYTDPLTGLYNRRFFNIIFDRELKRAKRQKNVISFMMIDVDFFKQYNDTYGHLEGDKALQKIANVFNETLKRPSDFIFRLGGEEFGILIVDNDATHAQLLAQKLVQNVEQLEMPHCTSEVSDFITISVGIMSTLPEIDFGEQRMIQLADEQLYSAKTEGRNRVCTIET